MNTTKKLALLREGTVECRSEVGFPQILVVSLDEVSYNFHFRRNEVTESTILTIYKSKDLIFKTKLVPGRVIPVYGNRSFFSSYKKKTLCTILPLAITNNSCSLKITWMGRR